MVRRMKQKPDVHSDGINFDINLDDTNDDIMVEDSKSENDKYDFVCDSDSTGLRADVYLSEIFSDSSRSYISKLIDGGDLTVNGKIVKPSFKLKENDKVSFTFKQAQPISISAENIPLDIIYQDEWIAVINKESGMVVHPAAGSPSGTMVNALLYNISDLSSINGLIRPGIVHRIDKDTTGILVVAKNDEAHKKLSEQLSTHSMVREYLALVEGKFKDEEGTIKTLIGRDMNNRMKMAVTSQGREAITHFKVLARYKNTSLLRIKLETGRTHQIRVHMAHIGHPVCGDPVYGFKNSRIKADGQLLHAGKLGFIHPGTGEYIEFNKPVHEKFKNILIKQYKESK